MKQITRTHLITAVPCVAADTDSFDVEVVEQRNTTSPEVIKGFRFCIRSNVAEATMESDIILADSTAASVADAILRKLPEWYATKVKEEKPPTEVKADPSIASLIGKLTARFKDAYENDTEVEFIKALLCGTRVAIDVDDCGNPHEASLLKAWIEAVDDAQK